MPLHTVESMRLYRQIAGQIASLIDNGEFPVGARLAPERELAVLLGVSRTSVREALIALEIAGRVEVRVGTGVFVRSAKPRRALLPAAGPVRDDGPGPFELLAARGMIEGEIAALAARNARKADVAALRETITRMREHADNLPERNAADRAFHVLIAESTRNGALAATAAGLWDQRGGELWNKVEDWFHTPVLRQRILADHEAIAAAIEARNPDRARAAMQRHLRGVAREFQRGWEESSRASTEKGAGLRAVKQPGRKPSQQQIARRTHPEGASS